MEHYVLPLPYSLFPELVPRWTDCPSSVIPCPPFFSAVLDVRQSLRRRLFCAHHGSVFFTVGTDSVVTVGQVGSRPWSNMSYLFRRHLERSSTTAGIGRQGRFSAVLSLPTYATPPCNAESIFSHPWEDGIWPAMCNTAAGVPRPHAACRSAICKLISSAITVECTHPFPFKEYRRVLAIVTACGVDKSSLRSSRVDEIRPDSSNPPVAVRWEFLLGGQ